MDTARAGPAPGYSRSSSYNWRQPEQLCTWIQRQQLLHLDTAGAALACGYSRSNLCSRIQLEQTPIPGHSRSSSYTWLSGCRSCTWLRQEQLLHLDTAEQLPCTWIQPEQPLHLDTAGAAPARGYTAEQLLCTWIQQEQLLHLEKAGAAPAPGYSGSSSCTWI